MGCVVSLDLAEPFAITDLYCEGAAIEELRNGLYRIKPYRESSNGPEALPYALVMAMPDIVASMHVVANGIGFRFSGTFHWVRPN